ncbi:MAG: thermonuclease family protein, partial [Eubacteriales bacterium]|nr:thermonuclease family protein [Eubacteriales bacterium]
DRFRLKRIDCPELGTPEGEAAKRFVRAELSRVNSVTIQSTASGNKEKWGRYLVDVFYERAGSGLVYLNQLLLDKGHAVRMNP